MFELNTLQNPDLLWQYIIMIAVAMILGALIGLIYERARIKKLTARLEKLDQDLEDCTMQQYGQE